MAHRTTAALTLAATMAVAAFAFAIAQPPPAAAAHAPRYLDGNHLAFPANYREWIYLSSGLDMSYRKDAAAGHSMFDNVFVNPAAYRAFLDTGSWPEHTELVMEVRGATSKGSINRRGSFQTGELMGVEVHLKDSARFPGGWAFFAFDGSAPAAPLPATAECYACHREHGAVATTFVQFYPTLLDLAGRKGTLSAAYLKDPTSADAAAK